MHKTTLEPSGVSVETIKSMKPSIQLMDWLVLQIPLLLMRPPRLCPCHAVLRPLLPQMADIHCCFCVSVNVGVRNWHGWPSTKASGWPVPLWVHVPCDDVTTSIR